MDEELLGFYLFFSFGDHFGDINEGLKTWADSELAKWKSGCCKVTNSNSEKETVTMAKGENSNLPKILTQ